MSDLVLLILIILGGALVIIVGLVIQSKLKKKKELEEETMYSQGAVISNQNTSNMSEIEQQAKTYIQQYKTSYPKESLKQGLMQMDISDQEADNYLNKYF